MGSRASCMALGFLFLVTSGCSKERSGEQASGRRTSNGRSNVAQYILDSAPQITHALDASFDDAIELLGYDVAPGGVVQPNAPVTLTLYWRLRKPLHGLWKLSSALIDDSGKSVLDLNRSSPIRAGRPGHPKLRPARWSPGKVYVDKLTFRAPAAPAGSFRVVAGVYTNRRLNMRVSEGQRADELHALVTTLTVAQETPTLSLAKLGAASRIQIDGKLDEPAWQSAPQLGPFVRAPEEPRSGELPRASGRLLWSAQGLYVAYEVRDRDVRGGPKTAGNGEDFEAGDGVALVVDTNRDDKGDHEVRVSPRNVVYDAELVAKSEGDAPQRQPRMAKSSRVRSVVDVKATLDNADDDDAGYVVEAMIPWSTFGEGQAPPVPGEVWKLNLYSVDQGMIRGWSPVLGKEKLRDAARFGEVRFAEAAPAPHE